MRSFKRFSAAVKYAKAQGVETILEAGLMYVVLDEEFTSTEFRVIDYKMTALGERRSWQTTGHVTLGNLRRLKNANWAKLGWPT